MKPISIDRTQCEKCDHMFFNRKSYEFMTENMFFRQICVFFAINDVIRKRTERTKFQSRPSCHGYCSLKSHRYLMKIKKIDRKMFSLFRNKNISSNGYREVKILQF